MRTREPEIHSHITDLLPDEHPLAYKSVHCEICMDMLHAANNECMSTWVETGVGNFCLLCFIKILVRCNSLEAFDNDIGLI